MKDIEHIATLPLIEVEDYTSHIYYSIKDSGILKALENNGYTGYEIGDYITDFNDEQLNIVYQYLKENGNFHKVIVEEFNDKKDIYCYEKLDTTHLELDSEWNNYNSTLDQEEVNRLIKNTYIYEVEENTTIASFKNTYGFNYDIQNCYSIKKLLNISDDNNINLFDHNELIPNGKYYVGKLDKKNKTLKVYSFIIDSMPVVYGFMGGFGNDGGFGDYSEPCFGNLLVKDNIPILVSTIKEAKEVVEKCNDKFENEFYSHGCSHDSYDGLFPYEITTTPIPTFGNTAIPTISSKQAINIIFNNENNKNIST